MTFPNSSDIIIKRLFTAYVTACYEIINIIYWSSVTTVWDTISNKSIIKYMMCKTIGNSCYSHNVSLLDVGSVILPAYDVTGTSLILGEQYKKNLCTPFAVVYNLFSLRVFIIVHCSQKKPVVNYTLSCEKPLIMMMSDVLGKVIEHLCTCVYL